MTAKWSQDTPNGSKIPQNGHKVTPNMVLDGSWMEYDGDRWSGCELDGVRWGWVELDGCKREVDPLPPAQLVLTELNTFRESETSFLKMKLEPLAFFFNVIFIQCILIPRHLVDHFKLFLQLFTVHLCGCRKRTIILDGNQGCGTLTAHFIRKLQVMQ